MQVETFSHPVVRLSNARAQVQDAFHPPSIWSLREQRDAITQHVDVHLARIAALDLGPSHRAPRSRASELIIKALHWRDAAALNNDVAGIVSQYSDAAKVELRDQLRFQVEQVERMLQSERDDAGSLTSL